MIAVDARNRTPERKIIAVTEPGARARSFKGAGVRTRTARVLNRPRDDRDHDGAIRRQIINANTGTSTSSWRAASICARASTRSPASTSRRRTRAEGPRATTHAAARGRARHREAARARRRRTADGTDRRHADDRAVARPVHHATRRSHSGSAALKTPSARSASLPGRNSSCQLAGGAPSAPGWCAT